MNLAPDRARNVPDIFDNYQLTIARFMAGLHYRGDQAEAISKFTVEARLASLRPDSVRLYWIDGPMLELAAEVAERLPADTRWSDVQPPSDTGFAVFAERLFGLDVLTGTQTVPLDGMAWTPTRLPWVDEPGADPVPVIGRSYLAVYRADGTEGRVKGQNEAEVMWVPLGRSDWVPGETIDEVNKLRRMDSYIGTLSKEQDAAMNRALADPEAAASIHLGDSASEDRRLLAALWMLMGMERAADVTRWAPRTKSAKRRTAGREPSVTVVHLRRERSDLAGPAEPEAGSTSRKYVHRWVVAPHPRWQACGPQWSQRKLILVEPHTKGPEGAPFVKRKRVWSLDR